MPVESKVKVIRNPYRGQVRLGGKRQAGEAWGCPFQLCRDSWLVKEKGMEQNAVTQACLCVSEEGGEGRKE